MRRGERVTVAPGSYRVGESPNAHIVLNKPTAGMVRLDYGDKVLVYLDNDQLPNPWAPGSAMVPLAALTALDVP